MDTLGFTLNSRRPSPQCGPSQGTVPVDTAVSPAAKDNTGGGRLMQVPFGGPLPGRTLHCSVAHTAVMSADGVVR